MTDEQREATRRLEDQEVALRVEKLEENQEKVFDVLIGPKDTWGVRDKEKGLQGTVTRIDETISNGGIRVKLPPGLWGLLVAIAGAIGGIAIALINSPPQP